MQKIVTLLLMIVISVTSFARQQPALSLIRDAEIEETVEMLTLPLLQAAKIDPKAFRIYLINDKSVNAFAAGGQNIFLHTGLIQKTTHPNQLMGVIAHEIGHIAGGHLTRMDDALSKSYRAGLLGLLIGAAASVAARDVSGLIAGGVGGMSMMQRNLFRFTRTQESSADQAALMFLKTAKQSPQGLMEIFKILKDQSVMSSGFQDPYLRTHPFIEERVSTVVDAVEHTEFKQSDTPQKWIDTHKRMIAKLDGFLMSPGTTLRKYKSDDSTACLARAVAYHKRHELPKAKKEVDELLKRSPADPYYHELKGQILFEHGKLKEALPCYQQAHKLRPENALIRVGMAQIMLGIEDKSLQQEAIGHLQFATHKEPDSDQGWYFLSIGFGREGKIGEAAYALAEYNVVNNKLDEALHQVRRSQKLLAPTSPYRRKLEDIKREIDYIKRQK
jgi:predicted Zn-dependent protease